MGIQLTSVDWKELSGLLDGANLELPEGFDSLPEAADDDKELIPVDEDVSVIATEVPDPLLGKAGEEVSELLLDKAGDDSAELGEKALEVLPPIEDGTEGDELGRMLPGDEPTLLEAAEDREMSLDDGVALGC